MKVDELSQYGKTLSGLPTDTGENFCPQYLPPQTVGHQTGLDKAPGTDIEKFIVVHNSQ
jgi:hypothetical protein